jgi:4-aminobutyrate aminotransferase/(S)-3-amino-2-methylpropionate transaminase
MFANSGAEAVENAVKIARKHTGRPAIVVFDHAFHGRTLMAMSLTAKVMPYKQGMGPFAPEIYRLPLAYPYRCPTGGTEETCAESCLAYAVDEMHKHIGEENIAAILIEPIQGEGGFIVPAPGFIAGLAEFAADQLVAVFVDAKPYEMINSVLGCPRFDSLSRDRVGFEITPVVELRNGDRQQRFVTHDFLDLN